MKDFILPTFFLAGAPKSGTTLVADVLSSHKDIFVPRYKEPAFFSVFSDIGTYDRGLDFYARNFIGYSAQKHICDASTVYFYDPETINLMKRHVKNPKIVFLLREPVSRLYSNYWQYIKSGRRLPLFEDMIANNDPLICHMKSISRYDLHIARFASSFGVKNIYVDFYENLIANPSLFFENLCQFLGLDSDCDLGRLNEISNPHAVPVNRGVARLLRNKSIVQSIKQYAPPFILPALKRTLSLLRRKNQKVASYPQINSDLKLELVDEFSCVKEWLETDMGLVVPWA